MNPNNWSGSLEKRMMTYNPTSGSITVSAAISWDAGTILTTNKLPDGSAAVAWNDRKVFIAPKIEGAEPGEERDT